MLDVSVTMLCMYICYNDVCEKLMHHITMLRCIVIQCWMYCYDVCEKLMHHITMYKMYRDTMLDVLLWCMWEVDASYYSVKMYRDTMLDVLLCAKWRKPWARPPIRDLIGPGRLAVSAYISHVIETVEVESSNRRKLSSLWVLGF